MRAFLPLLIFAAAACHKQPAAPDNGATNVGAPGTPSGTQAKLDRRHAGEAAPTTIFEDGQGHSVTLADFQGKPLLLNLWATWCAPCKKELPTLDGLAAARGGTLQVLAVAEDQDGRSKVDAYVKQAGFKKLAAYLDPKLALTDALRVNDLPTTILYDAKGREVWRMLGDRDWRGGEIGRLVDEASR